MSHLSFNLVGYAFQFYPNRNMKMTSNTTITAEKYSQTKFFRVLAVVFVCSTQTYIAK